MPRIHHQQAIPRAATWAAGTLVVVSMLFAAFARQTQIGTTALAPSSAVEVRALRFADQADGAIAIYRAGEPAPTLVLAPGGDGFVRGVLRGLARERKRNRIGAEHAYELARRADGRLTITDPTTGRHLDLGAFGPANYGAFAHIFGATAPPAEVADKATPRAAESDSANAPEAGARLNDTHAIARKSS